MGIRMTNIATPMPQLRAKFTNKLGLPLSGGKVYTYEPGTDIHKKTWRDVDKSVENTNPIQLDAAGEADIYGVGFYRVVVKDFFGLTIYDVEKTGIAVELDASLVIDGDKNQHQINEEQKETNIELSTFKAESDTVAFPMINVIRDRIIVDTYAKSGDSSHVQAINRAILASRDYSQAAIWFNNHDYELDDTILLSNLGGLQLHFAGGQLVATTANKNIMYAENCTDLKIEDIKILGLGAQTSQSQDEFGIYLEQCTRPIVNNAVLREIRGQSGLRLRDCLDSTVNKLDIDRYSYAGLQVLGASKNTVINNPKIYNGLGVSTTASSSGYGIHLSMHSAAVETYPDDVFINNFDIFNNNWDAINSHGGKGIYINGGKAVDVKNGIELAVDSRYSGSYLSDVFISDVNIECFKNPWDIATQGVITNVSSGIAISGDTAKKSENVNLRNCHVKYANNSGGGNGDNAGIRLLRTDGLKVNSCSVKESKVQGLRLYGGLNDFSVTDFTAIDVTAAGVQLGTGNSNGSIVDTKFGNSGDSAYTATVALQGVSTGGINVVERNTQLLTANVSKYPSTSGGQLRFKQEYLDPSFNPNNAAYSENLAGFKVGDVLRSPTVFSDVMYSGWMCTAIDTVTPSMTWKRYGAAVD